MKRKKSLSDKVTMSNLEQSALVEMSKNLGQHYAREIERVATLHEVFMVKRIRLPREKLERKVIVYAQKFMEPYHGIDHYLRVRLFAQVLWEHVGGDLDSIMAAIWLHDTGRIRRGMRDYELINAKAVYAYLKSIDFKESKRIHVIDAILTHDKNSGHKSDVQRVVHDAHELDAFTCSGLFRCIAERQVLGESYHFPVVGLKLKSHMLMLADNMQTDLGKSLARKRLEDFFGQLLDFVEAEQMLQFRLASPSYVNMSTLFDLNRSDSIRPDDEEVQQR